VIKLNFYFHTLHALHTLSANPERAFFERRYKVDYSLEPGDILLFKKKPGFDIWGSLITSEERDTDVCHAAFIGLNGDVWTTGANKIAFYGQESVVKYLKDKSFYACRFDYLSPLQLSIIDTNGKRMEGMMYGFWKVFWLVQKSKFGGVVKRLYPWLTKIVKDPFCSEAVADSFWRAGLRVCEVMGKEEPSAITPANLKSYAQLKSTMLNIVQEVNQ
jgi:hypothetical protein